MIIVDTETVRLEAREGHITVWDIALITTEGRVYEWQIKPNIALATKEALEIGRYRTRIHSTLRRAAIGAGWCKHFNVPIDDAMEIDHLDPEQGSQVFAGEIARDIQKITEGHSLVGSNPSFDMAHLGTLLQRHNFPPKWHYHPLDISSMALGYLHGSGAKAYSDLAQYEKKIASTSLASAVGIDREFYEGHTALGDALWAYDQYRIMTDGIATTTDTSMFSGDFKNLDNEREFQRYNERLLRALDETGTKEIHVFGDDLLDSSNESEDQP